VAKEKHPSDKTVDEVKSIMTELAMGAPTCNAMLTLDRTMITGRPHRHYWRSVTHTAQFKKKYDELNCENPLPAFEGMLTLMGSMCDCVRADGHEIMGKRCITARSPRPFDAMEGLCRTISTPSEKYATFFEGEDCEINLVNARGRIPGITLDKFKAFGDEICDRE